MIELVSVHIPKTAGTSFGALLEALYGDRLHRPDPSLPWEDMARDIPERARAVHGHLMPRDFLRVAPASRIATWVRDPVEWVTSYYYFWLELPPDDNPNHDKLLANRPSIVEFTELGLMEPTPKEYFADVPLGRVGFIGSFEEISADVDRFLRWLADWADPAALASPPTALLGTALPVMNPTRGKAPVSERERAALRALLAADVAFYEEALSLRRARLAARP